jgi:hypothetical protein
MIDEKYLQMAINIRRTYLKLINNMDLYIARALQVSDKLDETLKKLNTFNEKLSAKNPDAKKTNLTEKEIFENLLKIIDEVEEEGRKLETLISPVNLEIEKLSKEEMELYRLIVDNHPMLTEDQIVEKVQDRLIKEGLS